MRGILKGTLWGTWWGGLLLALAAAYRPGFLALGEPGGWLAIAVALLPFALLGFLVGWLRRRRPHRLSWIVAALAWLALPLLVLAGRAFEPSLPQPRLGPWRVVVLGLDGATWDVIRPMAAAGELPSFARLLDEGATGALRSEEPSLSPRVWTTIATGVGPDRHGASDFFSTQASIEVPRIWEVVDSAGGRVGIWAWLLTWPPGQPHGFLVPGWLAKGTDTWPPELEFFQTLKGGGASSSGVGQLAADALAGFRTGLRLPTLLEAVRVALWMKLTHPSDRESTPATGLLQAEMSTDLFLHLWKHRGPDFGALVLYPTDTFAHAYWRDFEPARFGLAEPPDGGRFGEVIPDAYRQADRTLGRLMAAADDRTLIVVLSDHGSGAREGSYSTYNIRSEPLLRALGMEHRLHAFSVGGYLHVRETGEVGGTADGGPPPFVETLRAATVDGQPLFDVQPSDPPYYTVTVHGDPDPSRTAHIGDREVPLSRLLIVSQFTGEHRPYGILGLWGSPVAAGTTIEGATLRDIAPTVLALLRCPVSREMTGRVLREGFGERAASRLEVKLVDSYGPPPHRVRGETPAAETDPELAKKLRALGYLQ